MFKVTTDLTGKRFGRLVVERRDGSSSRGYASWACVCDCGNDTTVASNLLVRGSTASCGCLSSERASERAKRTFTTHGRSKTPEYIAWVGMKSRCYDQGSPAFSNYGGRGIRVCDEWRSSFETFLADMGCRPDADHSLDRVDPNGNYCRQNCIWGSRDDQIEHRRVTVYVDIDGDRRTILQWSKISGVPPHVIRARILRGTSGRDSVFKPYRRRKNSPSSEVKAVSKGGVRQIWQLMKKRCTNPASRDYALYGGRGIVVCEEWMKSFDEFYAHVGARPSSGHTLDRIDNNGNYEPGNVKWSTHAEQATNRRGTRMITHGGRTQSLSAWASEIGIKKSTLVRRIASPRWTTADALTTPLCVSRARHSDATGDK
jgi:hypothetical protein